MYLRRDYLLKKQLKENKVNESSKHKTSENMMLRLKEKALEQLTINRIKNREIQYHKIELFLLVGQEQHITQFYKELKTGLQNIFEDDKAKKIFDDKWTHSVKSNVMGLFNKIACDFYDHQSTLVNVFANLYADTILKLLREDKISRIEEKLLDCFLVETMKRNQRLQILGNQNHSQIVRLSEKVRKMMDQHQIPKSLSNHHFLQYAVISILRMELPHQKYLYNQLMHAPNPKFLLPFRRKGVFPSLTNQILIKLNKIDMVGLRYWSYYDYEECDLYPSIRRAVGWQFKIDIMLSTLKSKISSGLQKYMNLISEKIKSYSNRNIDEAGVNIIASYSQICLQISRKKDPKEQGFSTALEKVDLGQVFQQKTFIGDSKLKQCMLKLVELYFQLLMFCNKKNLKLKFLQKIVNIVCMLLKNYNDEKFKNQLTHLVLRMSDHLSEPEKRQMLYLGIDHVNRDWEKHQELSNAQIIKINPFIVSFLTELSFQFSFDDEGRADYKVLKLEFFYILAINFNQSEYYESKKKLSLSSIDINHPLSNNMIFNILEVRKVFYEGLKKHLRSVFGDYQLDRPQHQGLLAVIHEIVSFRIQTVKENFAKYEAESFYSLLFNFLEQTERADSSGKFLNYVKNYFIKCNKTYMIQIQQLKFQDSGKNIYSKLLTFDVSFVVEGTITANPILSEFCRNILFEYVELYPELAFHTKVLTVLAQCISVLYRKSTQEYESKSEKLKGKYLVSNILIPTKSKQVTQRLITLMTVLYHIILRGYLINDSYLRIRILYLVKENSKTANITFGWKYLKHLIGNFKQDKQLFIKEVFMNNSGTWFINEELFSRKVRQMKPEKILLDKYLLPIHMKKCTASELKKVFINVQPQLQVQFIIVPPQSTERQIENILDQLEIGCAKVQSLHEESHQSQEIEEEQNRLYQILSRIKTIYISDIGAIHAFNRLLQVSRKYNNQQLFNYILLKVVPLFYCMTNTVLKSLAIISQNLHYIVNELNCVGKLYIEQVHNKHDTFNIKTNYFGDKVKEYEKNQHTDFYQKTAGYSKRYLILRLHERRMYCLQKMYRYILKFLSAHLDVFVAMGVPLMEFTQIFKISFLIHPEVMEFLSLESIGYCLTSHLQLVNLLKSSVEKGEMQYDDSFIDEFYFQTLRMGLLHFQKRKTYSKQSLLKRHTNIKSIKTKITFFIQICDYLRNQDFHRFRKKKLPKRQEIFSQNKNDGNMLMSILKYTQRPSRFERGNVMSLDQGTLLNSKINNFPQFDVDMTVLRFSLLYLISEQVDKIKAFSFNDLKQVENPYSLTGKKKFINFEQILKLYDYFGEKSLVLVYTFVKTFGNRIDNPQPILRKIKEIITKKPDYGFPEFLNLFIEQNMKNKHIIKKINYWKPPDIQVLFKYLTQDYKNQPYLQLYVTKVLTRLDSQQILFYLPQIYQALTLPKGQIVYDFLLQYARKSASFAHQLIWISKVESQQQRDPHNKNPRLPGVDQNLDKLQQISKSLIKDIIRQFSRQQKSFFKEVDQFYEEVTAVSGKLDPKWMFAQKKERIQEELAKIEVPKSVYLPTNPFFQVLKLKSDSGIPMQSAAKCPFLLTFICRRYVGPDIDFEQRKQMKKENKYVDSDDQFEEIKKQEIPNMLPVFKSSRIGGKIGGVKGSVGSSKMIESNGEIDIFSSNGDSRLKLDINDIKLTLDEGSQNARTPINVNNSKMLKKQTMNLSSVESQFNQANQQVEVSCIFKVFDDIRQDSLALQVIQLFMEIFQKHKLQLKLFPYKTISNRTGKGMDIGGIIQVVPKTVSRDSIGKTNQESLYQFFISNFGPEYNSVFQQARENFIKSQAAYSIISYILQIKDRHNGNILINKEEGYLVHIDFGFIFDISPANNLRFERADFKLTEQMIKIMGGRIDSQPFQLYMSLVIKGFLIARRYHEHIINLVKLMFNSGLPCFLQKSLANLQKRFVLQMSEIQAAEYMKQVIEKAADHWTTNWYDKIQWIQQRIYH